jgi:hypothetical protein
MSEPPFTPYQPEVKAGQIWREMDRRYDRHVKVISAISTQCLIRTVLKVDGKWVFTRLSREAWAARSRFKGRRGGYEFVEMGE